MYFKLFLLFLIVPVIEIYLLIKVGSVIGGVATVATLLAISLFGAWLMKSQGGRILTEIRDELSRGRLPAARMLDGALVFIGGVLLATPGFFTDFLGIFFLIPATRRVIKGWLGLWLQSRISRGGFVVRHHR
ncbi:FxsA cytoplasmic membrane protein [Citrifermentans bremense]|uniref:FxsA cytoplasmic membrane protein n=1 Tax=Citrifermentans bremense TaxID=60035 RepID=A0A6S6M3F0_9BACT|nr:FxsA family protein [Citrifermentans bremense]BCG46181.1 FxsA cytoplasmic membrane protein [Citrifermentans bremense]